MLDIGLTTWRRAGGSGAAPAWSPTDLGASLIAWWSADVLANGVVASWADSVGGLTLVQATEARKPIKAATSFNSAYPGVTFDGTDDRVTVTGTGSLPVDTTACDIYVMASQGEAGSVGGARYAFAYGAGGAFASRNIVRQPISTVNRLRVFDANAATALTDTVHDLSGAHIIAGRFQSATQTAWLDGKATTPATTASAFNTIGSTFTTIGATVAGATLFWLGVIRHVFVCAVLSDANRQKLEGWMAHNSGLAANLDVSHPYKAAPP